MTQEMRSIILLGTVLIVVIASLTRDVYGRAIDDLDVDNSIEPKNNRHSLFGSVDWLSFVKSPPEKVVQELGASIELTCEVMGTSVPTLRWIRGRPSEKEVENLETNTFTETGSTAITRVRSVLVIDHTFPNERTFTCISHGSGQTIFASTTVYPSPDYSKSQNLPELLALNNKVTGPRKPKIIYNYVTALDFVGSNVVLPCKAIGRPRPEIYWTNNDGVITGNDPKFKILPNGDLLISELRWADMGYYKCVARNSIAKDVAETFVYPVSNED